MDLDRSWVVQYGQPDYIFHVSLLSPLVCLRFFCGWDRVQHPGRSRRVRLSSREFGATAKNGGRTFAKTVQFHCTRIVFFGSFAKKSAFVVSLQFLL